MLMPVNWAIDRPRELTLVFADDVTGLERMDRKTGAWAAVKLDGRRAVLMTILKGEGASTLSVVKRVREALPNIQAQLPPDLKFDLLFDQSVFVEAAVEGVVKEAAIAAGLTALMILLFLGSLGSTLIIAISIPLSILTSLIALSALGGQDRKRNRNGND